MEDKRCLTRKLKIIKIYGERNTGTNYLEQLLETNLQVTMLKYVPNRFTAKVQKYEWITDRLVELNKRKLLGWKHGLPRITQINDYKSEDLIVVTITKNPYSFLYSLNKRRYQYKGSRTTSFQAFLNDPWPTIPKEHCNGQLFPSPMDLWNVKNKAYLSLPNVVNKTVVNIKYETLIIDPEKTIREFTNLVGAQFKNEQSFQNIINSTKKDPFDFCYYKNYYENELWRKEFDRNLLEIINLRLDFKLMHQLGYSKIKNL